MTHQGLRAHVQAAQLSHYFEKSKSAAKTERTPFVWKVVERIPFVRKVPFCWVYLLFLSSPASQRNTEHDSWEGRNRTCTFPGPVHFQHFPAFQQIGRQSHLEETHATRPLAHSLAHSRDGPDPRPETTGGRRKNEEPRRGRPHFMRTRPEMIFQAGRPFTIRGPDRLPEGLKLAPHGERPWSIPCFSVKNAQL